MYKVFEFKSLISFVKSG